MLRFLLISLLLLFPPMLHGTAAPPDAASYPVAPAVTVAAPSDALVVTSAPALPPVQDSVLQDSVLQDSTSTPAPTGLPGLLLPLLIQLITSGAIVTAFVQFLKRTWASFDNLPSYAILIVGALVSGLVAFLNQKFGFHIPTDLNFSDAGAVTFLTQAVSVVFWAVYKALGGKPGVTG